MQCDRRRDRLGERAHVPPTRKLAILHDRLAIPNSVCGPARADTSSESTAVATIAGGIPETIEPARRAAGRAIGSLEEADPDRTMKAASVMNYPVNVKPWAKHGVAAGDVGANAPQNGAKVVHNVGIVRQQRKLKPSTRPLGSAPPTPNRLASHGPAVAAPAWTCACVRACSGA